MSENSLYRSERSVLQFSETPWVILLFYYIIVDIHYKICIIIFIGYTCTQEKIHKEEANS